MKDGAMYKYVLFSLLALSACAAPLQQSQSDLRATAQNAAVSGGNPGSIVYPGRSVSSPPMALAQKNDAAARTEAGAGEQE
jgi:hypothetical protein